MQDSALYSEWRERFPPDVEKASIEIQDWLRSGWLRIAYPAVSAFGYMNRPPLDPFAAYAHDEDSALLLMASLRNLSLRRSADDAIMLRRSVAGAICAWDFCDETVVAAIRLSFRVGSIFGCTEVCDALVGQAQTLVCSPQQVITGLADMAGSLGVKGRSLVECLVAVTCESNRISHFPYLMTRLIELCSQADVDNQRDLILTSLERYGHALAKCVNSIDALEALTDIVVSGLRLIEGVLTHEQLKRLDSITVYLDNDVIMSIPQVREAVIRAPHRLAFIEESMEQSGDFERCLLNYGDDHE